MTLRTIAQQIALERMADDNLNRGLQRREQCNRSPTMPDAKMTAGERILREWNTDDCPSTRPMDGIPGVPAYRLIQRIDSALAEQAAAKDAEIAELRGMLGEAMDAMLRQGAYVHVGPHRLADQIAALLGRGEGA